MIEIHGKYLVLLLQRNSMLGYIALPYLVVPSGKTVFALSERFTNAHVEAWQDEVNDDISALAKKAESYSDHELFRRFCTKKNKETASSFLKTIEPERIKKIIRPEVQKAVSEVLFKAMKIGLLVFMREDTRSVFLGDAIGFSTQPIDTTMQFDRCDDGIDYRLTFHYENQLLPVSELNTVILTTLPAWVLMEDKLYYFHKDFDANKLKPFLKKESLLIPQRNEKEYFRKYIRKSVRGGNVIAKGFDITDLYPAPIPVLSFEYNPFFKPTLLLYYIYGEKRIDAANTGKVFVDLNIEDDEYFFLKIHRDAKAESIINHKLSDMGMVSIARGTWSVKEADVSTESFLQWVNANAGRFKEEGFYLENNYYEKNYYLGGITLEMNRDDGNDWFDLKMIVVLENGVEIPFSKLKNNILNGRREYRDSDGLIFIIPEEWFAQYGDLCELGKFKGEKVRINSSFYPVFKELGWSLPDTVDDGCDAEELMPPEALNATLRPYQIDGYRWFRKLDHSGLGGCLADDMGLGKTVQTIAYLISQYEDAQPKDNSLQDDSGQLDLFADDMHGKLPLDWPSLIVMPASLVHNWYLELEKFAPSLLVYRHAGISRSNDYDRFLKYHIILTTYGTLRNDVSELQKINFKNVILDESQMIKNPDSKTHRAVTTLNSERRFVLSGTPVENSILDLWAQMDFVNPGMLGDKSMFKRVFLKPIVKAGSEEKMDKLRKIIAPFVLRRTKNMVAKELPAKMEQTVWCVMAVEQKTEYEEEKSRVRNELLNEIEEDDIPKNRFAVLQALTKLRQIACHPQLTGKLNSESGKFDTVLQRVVTVTQEGHKVLMFSSFVEHLKIYSAEFDAIGIDYEMLTGSTNDREKVIRNFRESENIKVFLISLKAGGVGINLTEADYVFILDPWWNPASENQAIDRTHRIGQEKSVFVYRFISKDTIEEKMLLLQNQKRELAQEIIRSGENPIFKMSHAELKQLFY